MQEADTGMTWQQRITEMLHRGEKKERFNDRRFKKKEGQEAKYIQYEEGEKGKKGPSDSHGG